MHLLFKCPLFVTLAFVDLHLVQQKGHVLLLPLLEFCRLCRLHWQHYVSCTSKFLRIAHFQQSKRHVPGRQTMPRVPCTALYAVPQLQKPLDPMRALLNRFITA